MGQKIQPLKLRNVNLLSSKNTFSHSLLFQRKFEHEIETKRFLSEIFQNNKIQTQNCTFEQSLRHGLLVKITFLTVESSKTHMMTKTPKKTSRVLGFPSFKKTKLKRFLQFSYIQKFKAKKKKFPFVIQKKVLLHLSKRKNWQPVIFVSSCPFFSYFSNKKVISLFRSTHRALYRYRFNKNFNNAILTGAMVLTFPGWTSLFTNILLSSFFRSRKHNQQLRFYRSLLSQVFKLNRSFSSISGLFFQLRGRLDKRSRTRSYKFFLGKPERQAISGSFSSKTLQAITKNGTFGLHLFAREN